ncbi:hypothetical protein ACFXD5_08150 [Streptomyces sp. NPDC059385]|uniref:hypothetical protein n=1 Tax=Streptomyces sp. NPDC059385 TaxID=3346817 RepID=UPI0036B13958
MFGQDGTCGYAAIWLIRPGRPLADGFGPWEAATSYEPDWKAHPNPEPAAIAEGFAPHQRRSAAAVIELAAQEFPDFDDTIMALCR